MNLLRYSKLWAALAGAVVVAITSYFGGAENLPQWAETVVAVITAGAVFFVRNSEEKG